MNRLYKFLERYRFVMLGFSMGAGIVVLWTVFVRREKIPWLWVAVTVAYAAAFALYQSNAKRHP